MKDANKNWLKIGAIFILALFCALIVFDMPAGTPAESFFNKAKFRLGLDLQGGTHLVYQADTTQIDENDSKSAVEGVRDVIERRVNAFGVSEPVVQTNLVAGDYRVIVELPGVKDVNQAIAMIGATPILEFKELNPDYSPELTAEEQEQLDEQNAIIKQQAQEILTRVLAQEDFEKLAREYSQDPGSATQGGNLGWAKRGMFVTEFEREIFDVLTVGEISPSLVETSYGYHIIKKIDERGAGEEQEVNSQHILFKILTAQDIKQTTDQWLNTDLSGKNLKRSQVQFDPNSGEPEVGLEFDDSGKDLFAAITGRNVGQPVAIFLDGVPISVPTVNEPIKEGKAVISGRFNIKEANELVDRLNAGALPVPINLISQQTVGASLGNESVNKSLYGGLIGLLAVAIFMIIFYRLPGLLSVLALVVYGLVVLTIFKVLAITLTLAGLAGFILSVGMAVDANVLIFERLKEELKNGRDIGLSIEEGFKRAWTSIRDSNLSTIFICLILFLFGTSIMRGFGLTLGIGVLVSMFSSIIVSKSFLRIFNKLKNKWFFGVKK